jgi:hypothetical protein
MDIDDGDRPLEAFQNRPGVASFGRRIRKPVFPTTAGSDRAAAQTLIHARGWPSPS